MRIRDIGPVLVSAILTASCGQGDGFGFEPRCGSTSGPSRAASWDGTPRSAAAAPGTAWSSMPGLIHTGACAGLDAHACSQHDNGSSWYDARSVPTIPPSKNTTPHFDHCAEEVAAASRGTGTRGG